MIAFDPRTTLARGDVAAADLEGLFAADRYVATEAMQASAPVLAIRRAPELDAEQVDQLVFGEGFDVLEEASGFGFGRARRDGYVGWVELGGLSAPVLAPTHRVGALRVYALAEPRIRSAASGLYTLNALVTVEETAGEFVRGARAGWFPKTALVPLSEPFESDPAAVAERFLGAPYFWGGRESLGLDCSGLVQQALYACGHACDRDTDLQRRLGRSVVDEPNQRGDLVFWSGHVGVMLDDMRLLHANAHSMAVACEPLAQATARIAAAGGGEVIDRRRL